MLDHALTQIRQYSRADFAVTLAPLDVLSDLALETRHKPCLEAIATHADTTVASRDERVLVDADMARVRSVCHAVHRAIEDEAAPIVPTG